MLYVVLALVIGAAALLVASLLAMTGGYAWGSVVLSALAAALLVTDALLRRRRRRALTRVAEAVGEHDATGEAEDASRGAARAEVGRPETAPAGAAEGDETTVIPALSSRVPAHRRAGPAEPATERFSAVPAGEVARVDLDPDVEPAEEDTDAADALVVADSGDQVVVIDQRPRYHTPGCRWVGAREVFTLPVNEVRDLGFTPCSLCAPDRRIAVRAKRAATDGSTRR